MTDKAERPLLNAVLGRVAGASTTSEIMDSINLAPQQNSDIYVSPLTDRYASQEMKQLFSLRTRYSTWRQLWFWLAESQKDLGLNISDEAIRQMRANIMIQDEDLLVIREEEERRN